MDMTKNRTRTAPIAVPRSNRLHTARAMTSLPAGRAVPILAVPMLREDAIRSGRVSISFESMETAELLMNAIRVDVKAYLVPTLALDRFNGMDALNRSYEGEPETEGGDVIPYIETSAFGTHGSNAVYKYLGLQAAEDELVNTMYLEAYNQIFNFRARNRSRDLQLRTRLQTDLAPAFWSHDNFKHIVPTFDQALIDGEVALNVVNSKMPVKNIGFDHNGPVVGVAAGTIRQSGPEAVATAHVTRSNNNPVLVGMKVADDLNYYPDIWAELQDNGITVSLSNIELAKKTAAFARLRQQYEGHSDEYLINLLMDGLTVPEQAFKQPMLIGEKTTIFGMGKRYATDSGNLTESVVNGATTIDMSIQLPRIPTGGVVMFIAEITPEQLFERQKDPFLHAKTVADFPAYLRDSLDPEPVSAVPCNFVDVDHDTPDALFGYAPLNYEWQMNFPRIGGKFWLPAYSASFIEDRQRLWAVETENPTLSTDFYLCTNMHTNVFVVTNQDPFESTSRGEFLIEGNTVFGPALLESSTSYDDVMAEAPVERIDQGE